MLAGVMIDEAMQLGIDINFIVNIIWRPKMY